MDEQFSLFSIPHPDHHPATIAARLLELEEHQHLKDHDATIDWLIRNEPKCKGGRRVLGTAYIPMVQGELRDCFEWLLSALLGRWPDFLIVIDREYWEQADARAREILVYHELSHCVQKFDAYGAPRFHKDGRPMWGLRGHDVEEFTATVKRYGSWSDEIKLFVAAAREGDMSQLRADINALR
jgi:hypothetical protein